MRGAYRRLPAAALAVHTIPHPAAKFPAAVGAVSRDVNAAGMIWDFFARQLGRPGGPAR